MVNQRLSRGNAMLITMIALAVLMVLVVGALRFTGSNREGAAFKAKGDVSAACADAAKRYLLSRLEATGVPVTGMVFDQVLPDHPVAANRSRILTAHYDSTGIDPTIVPVSSQRMGGSDKDVRDTSNTLSDGTLGGQYFRVVVKCREPSVNRESELEFVFRYGI